jgi:hypothetical protein
MKTNFLNRETEVYIYRLCGHEKKQCIDDIGRKFGHLFHKMSLSRKTVLINCYTVMESVILNLPPYFTQFSATYTCLTNVSKGPDFWRLNYDYLSGLPRCAMAALMTE